jgi:hypothetical protein
MFVGVPRLLLNSSLKISTTNLLKTESIMNGDLIYLFPVESNVSRPVTFAGYCFQQRIASRHHLTLQS